MTQPERPLCPLCPGFLHLEYRDSGFGPGEPQEQLVCDRCGYHRPVYEAKDEA